MLLGKHDQAWEAVDNATRLDPLHAPSLQWILGQVCYCLHHYEEAVRAMVGKGLINSVAQAFLAAAHAQAGRKADAAAALTTFIRHRRQEMQSRGIEPADPDIAVGLDGRGGVFGPDPVEGGVDLGVPARVDRRVEGPRGLLREPGLHRLLLPDQHDERALEGPARPQGADHLVQPSRDLRRGAPEGRPAHERLRPAGRAGLRAARERHHLRSRQTLSSSARSGP